MLQVTCARRVAPTRLTPVPLVQSTPPTEQPKQVSSNTLGEDVWLQNAPSQRPKKHWTSKGGRRFLSNALYAFSHVSICPKAHDCKECEELEQLLRGDPTELAKRYGAELKDPSIRASFAKDVLDMLAVKKTGRKRIPESSSPLQLKHMALEQRIAPRISGHGLSSSTASLPVASAASTEDSESDDEVDDHGQQQESTWWTSTAKHSATMCGKRFRMSKILINELKARFKGVKLPDSTDNEVMPSADVEARIANAVRAAQANAKFISWEKQHRLDALQPKDWVEYCWAKRKTFSSGDCAVASSTAGDKRRAEWQAEHPSSSAPPSSRTTKPRLEAAGHAGHDVERQHNDEPAKEIKNNTQDDACAVIIRDMEAVHRSLMNLSGNMPKPRMLWLEHILCNNHNVSWPHFAEEMAKAVLGVLKNSGSFTQMRKRMRNNMDPINSIALVCAVGVCDRLQGDCQVQQQLLQASTKATGSASGAHVLRARAVLAVIQHNHSIMQSFVEMVRTIQRQ